MVGCDGFLPKPIEVDKLLELMGSLMGLEWVYTADPAIHSETLATGGTDDTPEPVPDADFVVPPLIELQRLYELLR